MRVVFLSMHPGFGGAASANISICKMLSKEHKVFYVEEFVENLNKSEFDFNGNLKLVEIPLYKDRFRPWKMYQKINRLSPDYIFIGVPFILIYYLFPLFLFKIKGVKICMIFHSLGLKGNLKDKFAENLIVLFSLLMDKMFFVSSFTKNTWNKYYLFRLHNRKEFVIYNGIDSKVNSSFRRTKNSISFVGRLDSEKQPEIFCKLARYIIDQGCSYRFNIWGDGPLYDKLFIEYSDCVTFKGYCSNINEIYNDTDLLVMTSKFENCPMVILESRAWGIPVIAPRVGGIPEIVKNDINGLLYDKVDIVQISKMVTKIYEKYDFFSKNARESSLDTSYEVIGHMWLNILKK